MPRLGAADIATSGPGILLLTRRKAAAMRGKVVYIYMGKWSIISSVNPVVPNMEILNKDLHPFRVWLL